MRRTLTFAAATAAILMASSAMAQGHQDRLIAGKTGPLEAYAKQTETGFMMGLEYLTKGTMSRERPQDRRDREGRPAQARPRQVPARAGLRRRQGRPRGRHRPRRPSRSPCCRSPRRYKKILIVEPAVADAITGEKWNRYIFRTGRNSTQDALATPRRIPASRRRQRRDAGAGLRLRPRRRRRVQGALQESGQRQGRARGIRCRRTPPTSPPSAQRLFDALKDKPGKQGHRVHLGRRQHPLAEDRRPEARALRHRDRARRQHPAGDGSLEELPGMEGAIYYYYGFPKNPMNDWLVAEHQKRFNAPPDFFTAGGFAAAIGGRRRR